MSTLNVFRQNKFWVFALVAGLSLAVLTADQLIFAHQGPGVDKSSPPPPNACGSLPADEQAQCYNDATSRFDERYEAFIAGFEQSGVDPRTLERVPLQSRPFPGEESLDGAVESASAIVSGTATGVAFIPGGALVTFVVDEQITDASDDLQDEIVILMSGGPAPAFDQDWGSTDYENAVLNYSEGAPLLLPEDRAVLLLDSPDEDGHFRVQSFSGLYRMEHGEVHAVDGNRFAAQVDGTSEQALLDAFSRAAGP